jgi:hypothetical protein
MVRCKIDKDELFVVSPGGSKTEAFMLDGQMYLDLVSERRFDDSWEDLPISQSELYIYTFDSQLTKYRTACHLLYEQKATK